MNQEGITIISYPDRIIIQSNGARQEIRNIESECSSSWNIYFS